MLSKKDYEAIAAELAAAHEVDTDKRAVDAVERIAEGLARYFADDNPRFNRARFLRACGVME